jgi:single-stranded DNA-specific DHH superfamily exonuclease
MNYRKERIERLLNELRYEIERGMLEREIDEEISFRFVVPISQKIKNGVVLCEFRTKPSERYDIAFLKEDLVPKLKLVK